MPFSYAFNMGFLEEEQGYYYAPWYEAASVRGTANEIRGPQSAHVDYFAGLRVEGVSEGQHNGSPAVLLNLGKHGRVALLRDSEVEWIRDFHGEPDDGYGHDRMEAFLDMVEKRQEKPMVVTTTVDYNYEEDDENLDVAIAMISARFGVSIRVVDPKGPGGGWPVCEMSGLYVNVEKALREGWGIDETELYLYLDPRL